jgi:hypothetical protein
MKPELKSGLSLTNSRGPDYIPIYNEAFAPLAGKTHPALMGSTFRQGEWEKNGVHSASKRVLDLVCIISSENAPQDYTSHVFGDKISSDIYPK